MPDAGLEVPTPKFTWSSNITVEPADAEDAIFSTGELYRVSLRRQKFPAQGSIEIHEENEVGQVSGNFLDEPHASH